jgi:hypothetical protein
LIEDGDQVAGLQVRQVGLGERVGRTDRTRHTDALGARLVHPAGRHRVVAEPVHQRPDVVVGRRVPDDHPVGAAVDRDLALEHRGQQCHRVGHQVAARLQEQLDVETAGRDRAADRVRVVLDRGDVGEAAGSEPEGLRDAEPTAEVHDPAPRERCRELEGLLGGAAVPLQVEVATAGPVPARSPGQGPWTVRLRNAGRR